MNAKPKIALSEDIFEKAKEFGADLTGFADVAALKRSPSNQIYDKMDVFIGADGRDQEEIVTKGAEVVWPEDAKTFMVIGVHHPENNPELDCWQKDGQPGGTPGNLLLIRVFNKLGKWLKEEHGITPTKLPYHIEHGGNFLKDAAVLAKMGVVGKNNLFVSPEYGPRVRLRALSLPIELPNPNEKTFDAEFDPCNGCDEPCRKACPRNNFSKKIFDPVEFGTDLLPGRDGKFSRETCKIEMAANVDSAEDIMVEVDGKQAKTKRSHFCRLCELSCVVGKGK